jgi:glycerophosphoryl diester phosphodiesterase
LGRFSVSERSTLTLDVSSLPRNRPVTLSLVTTGKVLDCPTARGSGNDPRKLNIMLQSVELTPVLSAAPTQATATILAPEMPNPTDPRGKIGIEDATHMGPCVTSPAFSALTLSVADPLPLDQTVPVSDAIIRGTLTFGDGWWAEDEFGRWMGQTAAELAVVLPLAPENLELILSTAAFNTADVEVGLRFDGRLLSRQMTGLNSPLIVDVSDLPRGIPVTLVIDLLNKPLRCPASQNQTEDTRSLGIMLQAIRLSASERAAVPASIAHAGGRLNGAALTNSFEALESNLGEFDVFEIDFSWTADGKLVCLHDWEDSFRSRFDANTDRPLDYDMFRRLLASSPDRPQNCDLDRLAGWMRVNPGIQIVTDVKSKPLAAHEIIAARHPDLLDQFVPQAYQPEEIDRYSQLGFENVIWTLYRYGENPDAIIEASLGRSLMAIAMPQSMAEDGLLRQVTEATGIPVYIHTVNDPDVAGCMLAMGAAGIYSDDLGAEAVTSLRQTTITCS